MHLQYSRQAAQAYSGGSKTGPTAADGTEVATGLQEVWNLHPELTGKDVNIGFIDSGIAYYLAAMGTCSAVNTTAKPDSNGCRVVKGYDFVGEM